MYLRDRTTVTLTMTVEEYDTVMILLGYGMACAKRNGDEDLFRSWRRLCNSLNKGHPNYVPYEVPEA